MDLIQPPADAAATSPQSMASGDNNTSSVSDIKSRLFQAGANGGLVTDPRAPFRMGAQYEAHSQSQLSIGWRVIQDFLPQVLQLCRTNRQDGRRPDFAVLDIACGPGQLTAGIVRHLRAPGDGAPPLGADIRVDGLDIDPVILSRARDSADASGLAIQYHCADFRRPPRKLLDRYDLIFSNEGLHWTRQPPARFALGAAIFYAHLPDGQKKAFVKWATRQWKTSFCAVRRLLHAGGCAMLQFGSEGQLDALYKLFDLILSQVRFRGYKESIWFPLYYPSSDELPILLAQGGLEAVQIESWVEPLTEQTPAEVVQFARGWTEPYLAAAMPSADVEAFYQILSEMLSDEARPRIHEIQWHRTVVIARRGT